MPRRNRAALRLVALVVVAGCSSASRTADSTAPGDRSTTEAGGDRTSGAGSRPDGAVESASSPPTTTPASTAPPSTAPATTTSSTSTTTTVPGAVPVVEAAAYSVWDMRRGIPLTAANADIPRPVGDLMKLLAAQTAYEAGAPTKLVTAGEGLVLNDDERTVGIDAGQILSRDLLVRAMLKASANDATRLLALDIAGSEAAFAERMNATAAALGLANTRAVNPTGLDAEGQFSSANDMTSLAVRLMGNVTFQFTVNDETAELNGQAIENPNDLLGVYPGADGIMAAHTDASGWSMVGSATRDGRRIVVTVLGAPSEDALNTATAALLDWAFSLS